MGHTSSRDDTRARNTHTQISRRVFSSQQRIIYLIFNVCMVIRCRRMSLMGLQLNRRGNKSATEHIEKNHIEDECAMDFYCVFEYAGRRWDAIVVSRRHRRCCYR